MLVATLLFTSCIQCLYIPTEDTDKTGQDSLVKLRQKRDPHHHHGHIHIHEHAHVHGHSYGYGHVSEHVHVHAHAHARF